jgi:uncharacterized protein
MRVLFPRIQEAYVKILISGGTGLIGSILMRSLIQSGNKVICLTRSMKQEITQNDNLLFVQWDGTSIPEWKEKIGSVDAVINLAGENIGASRWSETKKHRMKQSRINAGLALSQLALDMPVKPSLLIQASAIGYYGTSETAILEESSPNGTDFLSRLAKAWEDSTKSVEDAGIGRAIIRTGIVLDAHKGVFPIFVTQAKYFAGGPLGDGKQWLSWIHIQDEVRAIQFILENQLKGVFNLVGPNPLTNVQMTEIIAQVLKRPYWLPAPAFALKILLGEMSILALEGQHVYPRRLVQYGYNFLFPEIIPALKDLLHQSGQVCHDTFYNR